jgi:hypothetical protein
MLLLHFVIAYITVLMIYYTIRCRYRRSPFLNGHYLGVTIVIIIVSIVLLSGMIREVPAGEDSYTIVETITKDGIHDYTIHTKPSWIINFVPTVTHTYDYEDNHVASRLEGLYDKFGNTIIMDATWIWSCNNPNVIKRYLMTYGDDWENYLFQLIYYEPYREKARSLSARGMVNNGVFELPQQYAIAKPYGFTKGTRVVENIKPRSSALAESIYDENEGAYSNLFNQYEK